jgi:hypothetical protein
MTFQQSDILNQGLELLRPMLWLLLVTIFRRE